jgi:EmrB/QacA subfamily drug resistance transporter
MNRYVPLILAVALFMEHMDATVIATSLPAIAADLGVGPISLKLAVTTYIVALAIFIPVSGWMADRFGAKRVFRIAIAVFMAGSLFCAVANSMETFVAARFLQGMGGAMMTPIARLVLVRTTEKRDLVSAMTLLTIPGLFGPLAGPPIGGFITTYFSWHWIFLINIPIGLLGLWATARYLPEIAPRNPPPLDRKGFALSALATSGIVFGVSVISMPALPPAIGLSSMIVGAICTVLYIRHAKTHPAPILDLRTFDNPTFRTVMTSVTIFRISTGALPFLMPLMLQIGFNLTPFQSGLITFSGAIGAISTKFVAQKVFAVTGFKPVLLIATVATTLTTLVNALFTEITPSWVIMLFLILAGFTRSFYFTGSNALSYSDITDQQVSQASSISSTLQQLSLALGVAFAATILEISTAIRGEPLSLTDFHIAFVVVALFSAISIIPLSRMDKNAGALVSGHRRKIQTAEKEA